MKKNVKTANASNPQPATSVNRKKILNSQRILSESQQDEIKKAFDFFDITGSGIKT